MKQQAPNKAFLESQWRPGQSGNPAGRPKGSRHKLTEHFLEELHKDFQEHGSQAIAECRENKPDAYLKIIASLVPKQFDLNPSTSDFDDFIGKLTEGEARGFLDALTTVAAIVQAGEAGPQEAAGKRPRSVH